MTINQHSLQSTLAVCLMGTFLVTAPAFAQVSGSSSPTGTYVFSESGPAFTSLAQLTFGADGSVTGQEMSRSGEIVSTYAIQGTYTSNNQTIALTLNATSLDATDAAGNPLTFTENVSLVGSATGQYVSIRTDAGLYATGSLVPAGTAVAKGVYLLNGKPVDPSAVSVSVVALDGAGNVGGSELLDSFGATNLLALTGTYARQPSGFQTLTMNGQAVDPDGNTVSSTEIYAFLQTRTDIRMIRTDNGPAGVFTLSQ